MRPLQDKVVLVTRPAERSRRLERLIEGRGARPLSAPTIELVPARAAPLADALGRLAAGEYGWVVLTSPATVDVLREQLRGPREVRAKVAAIGEGTSSAFRQWSRRDPDLQPPAFT